MNPQEKLNGKAIRRSSADFGYGFHIYDDRGAPWITISYATNDAATKARNLMAKALVGAISVRLHG